MDTNQQPTQSPQVKQSGPRWVLPALIVGGIAIWALVILRIAADNDMSFIRTGIYMSISWFFIVLFIRRLFGSSSSKRKKAMLHFLMGIVLSLILAIFVILNRNGIGYPVFLIVIGLLVAVAGLVDLSTWANNLYKKYALSGGSMKSEEEIMAMHPKKGKGLAMLLFGLFLLATSAVLGFSGQTKNQNTLVKSSAEILKEFPIYPDAKMGRSEEHSGCEDLIFQGRFVNCDKQYHWDVSNNYKTVQSWYLNDTSKSGFKCFHDPRFEDIGTSDYYLVCQKDNSFVDLYVGEAGDSTHISLTIPYKTQEQIANSSSFQKLISQKCQLPLEPPTYRNPRYPLISYDDLPVTFAPKTLQLFSEDKFRCIVTIPPYTKASFVEIPLKRGENNSVGSAYIYDKNSYNQSGSLDFGRGGEEGLLPKIIKDDGNIKLYFYPSLANIAPGQGYFVDNIVLGGQRELKLKTGEVIFVRAFTFFVIDLYSEDNRFRKVVQNLPNPHIYSFSDLEKNGYYDAIYERFFSDLSNLEEPEKSKIAELEDFLNNASLK